MTYHLHVANAHHARYATRALSARYVRYTHITTRTRNTRCARRINRMSKVETNNAPAPETNAKKVQREVILNTAARVLKELGPLHRSNVIAKVRAALPED